ncbi:type 12 methyltransferase [Mycolicibacterium aurum]|uniref:Type 12 methyltransferase n=1 Tax=Mycolicibacterium aurum TaxID=1791 RepID=A0A448IRD6_MYCAU|nr:class I SAM-dependent methyltransferase [Mycolicibacterium aurum]VEG55112.1 type 12 methyltransferase [Mycolicibacterium aurum]
MSGEDGARWDRKYTDRGPSALGDVALPYVFAPFADVFPTSGSALELACGDGGSAVWLARRGLRVGGYDVSAVAIAHARDLAVRSGQAAHCRFDVADFDDGLPTGEPVDVLLCNRFRDPRLYCPSIERLRDGGILAISVLSEVGGTPGAFRAKPGELLAAFASLDVIASAESGGEAWLLARRTTGAATP